MRLFIESSSIFSERWGIGQFTKRLIEAYHAHYPEQKIKLFGFKFITRPFTPPILQDRTLTYRLIRWLPGKIHNGLFKYGVGLPIDVLLGATRKDVLIFPNFVRWPLLANRRSIAFVHDISFITHGQFTSPANLKYMLKHVPQTIKKADHIVTISKSSQRDISKYYQIPKSRISIVNPFIDIDFFKRAPISEIQRVSSKLKLPKKYILFTGTIEPRKNIIGMLEAYEQLKPSIQKEYGLVLAGGKGWLNEDIYKKIDEMKLQGLDNIHMPGYIDDKDIVGLFSGATVFLFISHYEGFGIPPLEAMACGVPVIASNNSSLPEVMGNAGILVDADNTLATSEAITQLVEKPRTREKLVLSGYEQIKKFTPERSVEQLQSAILAVSK